MLAHATSQSNFGTKMGEGLATGQNKDHTLSAMVLRKVAGGTQQIDPLGQRSSKSKIDKVFS